MKYSGIDLHSNNSVVTVTDEEDRVIAEKRLPNDLFKIVGLLMPRLFTQAVHQAEVSLFYFVCVKDERRPDSSGVYNTNA